MTTQNPITNAYSRRPMFATKKRNLIKKETDEVRIELCIGDLRHMQQSSPCLVRCPSERCQRFRRRRVQQHPISRPIPRRCRLISDSLGGDGGRRYAGRSSYGSGNRMSPILLPAAKTTSRLCIPFPLLLLQDFDICRVANEEAGEGDRAGDVSCAGGGGGGVLLLSTGL